MKLNIPLRRSVWPVEPRIRNTASTEAEREIYERTRNGLRLAAWKAKRLEKALKKRKP